MGNQHKLSRANREQIDNRKERKLRTDLGIAIAHAISPPGRKWTLDEIALFAGCTEGTILAIHHRAMRKIRNQFLFSDQFFRELKTR